ncbi:MAG: hypothetical protein MPK03_06200 [Alphaproteobacteria bacterium]|nr:hypothetical protein [Alphaproteobacteria bacterium]
MFFTLNAMINLARLLWVWQGGLRKKIKKNYFFYDCGDCEILFTAGSGFRFMFVCIFLWWCFFSCGLGVVFFFFIFLLLVVIVLFFFIHFIKKTKKKATTTKLKKKTTTTKMTQASAWVKNSKVMPQLSRYLSFLLGKGGKPLYLKPY